jgi:TRAP-type C4-dicarboxylate transport system permease small subunit
METDDPSAGWFRYYFALAAGSWFVLALSWLSGSPLSPVGWTGAALVVSAGLSALVTLQYLDERGRTSEERSGYELLVDPRSGDADVDRGRLMD